MTPPVAPHDLQLATLRYAYDVQHRDPLALLLEVRRHADSLRQRNLWIELCSEQLIEAQVSQAVAQRRADVHLPLFGVPFAVKDNIDVAGFRTTAACPAFGAVADHSATVVQRLTQAGAIFFGKTNLDQFATGLVGTRSPYGACSSAFDDRYISGGSSSGSALAVALGCVTFALGTDTAGSGRVPAGFNNIVGLKPTRGLLSTRGGIPACRSLDCVSVFAGSVGDAQAIVNVAAGYDAADAYSRHAPTASSPRPANSQLRIGVPCAEDLRFDGDRESSLVFARAGRQLEALGAELVEVSLLAFNEAAALLYSGPWVAERHAAVGAFLSENPEAVHPIVASIIRQGERYSATDCFEGQYRLATLRRQVDEALVNVDALLVPTAPTCYTLDQVEEQPLELNSRLGWYTNFVNLLDLCGIAVPAGFKPNGLPFGVTLLGPAFSEAKLCTIAALFQNHEKRRVGATAFPVREHTALTTTAVPAEGVVLAVVGAHLRGQPLHHQLSDLGARFVGEDRTSATYQLYALATSPPAKPGLVRVAGPAPASLAAGSVDVELYALSVHSFGLFTAAVPSPLVIGNVELESGGWVKGFLCESFAVADATDITRYGGWRAYLAAQNDR